jgi:glycolate oxidase FAD binding subunit
MPTGDLVKSGGRVVKNVAGYDLAKLHIGALGSLGVIVQVSFKVSPLPSQALSLSGTSPNLASLLATALHARNRGLAVNGLAISRNAGTSAWTLFVRCAGGEAAVDRSRREVESFALTKGIAMQAAEASAWPTLPAFAPDHAIRVRASVLPNDVASMLEALVREDASIVAYPTAGVVYGSWPAGGTTSAKLTGLRKRAESAHGALVLESAPADLKATTDTWGQSGPSYGLMQRLKTAFDPNNVLNPGRYLGGI